MFQKILVPVDFSHEDVGQRILKRAAALCGSKGSIVAMHVVPVMPTYAEAYLTHDLYKQSAEEAKRALEALIKKSGVTASAKVDVGVAHAAILDEQKETDADLVIIGSHKPGLSDYILGSTASRVVRHAQCSVLVDR